MRSDLFRLRILMLYMFIQCHYGISHHHIAWISVAFPCSPFSSSCPLPSACCTSKPLDKDKHLEAGQHVNRTYEIFPIHFGKCILIYHFSQFSSSFQLYFRRTECISYTLYSLAKDTHLIRLSCQDQDYFQVFLPYLWKTTRQMSNLSSVFLYLYSLNDAKENK